MLKVKDWKVTFHSVLRKLYTEPSMLITKFQLIWPNGFREDFFQFANDKQELPMAAMEI